MPQGPVLPTPTPTTAAPTNPGRPPTVAADISVRPSSDPLPRSSARVGDRRLGNHTNRVSPQVKPYVVAASPPVGGRGDGPQPSPCWTAPPPRPVLLPWPALASLGPRIVVD